ncbi:MAG: hypothetical protein JST93_22845 [Acidobacteria bacterium]|nr:hypothetical protein [Acidobacteriota bacterium]
MIALLSGSSPAFSAGTDWPTRQIDDRVEQIESPNHTSVPVVCHARFGPDLPEVLAEAADPMDEETVEEETKDYILRSDLSSFRSPTSLHRSTAGRAAPTPFRLLAFSSRGSPRA